jgi:hypothetical protein
MKYLPQDFETKRVSYEVFKESANTFLAHQLKLDVNSRDPYFSYIQQNQQRINRWDRKFAIMPEVLAQIQQIQRPLRLVAIVEAWCGDVSQILPGINHMVNQSDKLTLEVVYRDENLPLIDAFLTNGGRAIPIILITDAESQEILGSWGPRPSTPQAMMAEMKKKMAGQPSDYSSDLQRETIESIHAWYARDKGREVQTQFMDTLLKALREKSVVQEAGV